MLHLYAALVEKERRLIGERTRAALDAKKASGARLGNPKNLGDAGVIGRSKQITEADRFAANTLPVVLEIRASGVRGCGAIAALMNERGLRTARGGRWHGSTVRNLFARVPFTADAVQPQSILRIDELSPNWREAASCPPGPLCASP
jgi:DNA invertase Pin-like site-specific DNA recombinase